MALSNFYLTDRGNALMAQTLTGSTITITKAQIGEGIWPDGTTFANVAALTAPIKDLVVARKRADSNGQTIVTVQFSTEGIGRAFNWSEFALWVADPASPDDRTQDFILGTSRALTEGEAVHFDAIQEGFNFNVILKTASADSVEIVFEGGAVYLTREDLDDALEEYIPTSEKGTSGGVAALDANGGLTLRQTKDNGAANFFKNHSSSVDYGTEARDIDKDGNIAGILLNAAQQTVKAKFSKGGSTSAFDLLHRGIPNLPAVIGAAANHAFVTGVNLLEWASEQIVGGPFFTNNDVTGVPSPGFWHGMLTMGADDGDKGLFIFNGTEAHVIATMARVFDSSEWRHFAIGDFLPQAGGTLNGSLSVNYGSGTLLSWLIEGETATAIEAYRANNVGRLHVVVYDDKADAYLSFADGNSWTTHQLLHTGNTPAVTATAELV